MIGNVTRLTTVNTLHNLMSLMQALAFILIRELHQQFTPGSEIKFEGNVTSGVREIKHAVFKQTRDIQQMLF